MSLANALFLYICCILEYLYFVNSINDIFSITFHIMIPRPHGVGRCIEFLTSKSLTDADGDTWSGLTALNNAPQYEPDLTGVSVCRDQNVIQTHRARLINL